MAVAYGAYRAEEDAARAAGRGLWALRFERPEAWAARSIRAEGSFRHLGVKKRRHLIAMRLICRLWP